MTRLNSKISLKGNSMSFKLSACIFLFAFTNLVNGQTLVWQDEFNGTSLNGDYWGYDFGDGCHKGVCGWGNGELEFYTSRTENVRVENGNLIIEARREEFGGYSFTSGRIKTEGRVHFKYGTLEARIKVPNLANGLWPAYWLLGEVGGWPSNGEIDISEWGHADAIAAGVVNRRVGGACHWDYEGSYAMYGNHTDFPIDLNNDYHIYKLVWDAQFIRCFVDDVEYYAIEIAGITENSMSEFHIPHYLILNLAVGGQYTGIYDANAISAPLPGSMQIDYIRLYQDNSGELEIGKNTITGGNFGVFTETTSVTQSLEYGVDANLYLWNNVATTSTTPYEGSEAWSFSVAPGSWWGLGVAIEGYKYLANYYDGELKFHMKTSSSAVFNVGVETGHGVTTVQFTGNNYGLVRDGNWHEVSIPFSEFINLDLGAVKQMFIISGDAPASTFDFAIDNIYYSGGGDPVDPDPDPDPDPTTKAIPGTIEAEAYDNMSGIDVEACSEGGENVGWIDAGDWMDYNVTVANTGSYNVTFRVAAASTDAKTVELQAGGTTATASFTGTGGWQVWTDANTSISLNAGTQTIRVYASSGGFNVNRIDFTYTGTDPDPDPDPTGNLALNKQTTVSSVENDALVGSSAVDGDMGTRWASAQSDPQWIYVDLGQSYSIDQVIINWETAMASDYQVQVSDNASSWTTVRTITGNTEAYNDNSGLNTSGRYVRIYGTARATQWGYSIFELEVYGSGSTPDPTPVLIHIEAEDYTNMNGIQTEATSDAGGGENVGWIDAGDWMDYSVNIPNTGTYNVDYRVASAPGGGQVNFEAPAGNTLAQTTIDATGGWQSWVTLSTTVNLSAGNQTIRLYSPSAGWNINWFDIYTIGAKSAGADESLAQQSSLIEPLVYPNPSAGFIYIELQNSVDSEVLDIYSPIGQLIESIEFESNQSIDVSHLESGLYIIRIQGVQNYTGRFIKK